MAQKLAERLGQAVIVYAKANPNLANYASSSATFQLATELFKMRTGAPLEHIPYKCSGKMLAAVIGSEVLMALANPLPVAGHVEAATAGVLAITSSQRATEYPDMPTMAEAGVPDLEVALWSGLFAPATPPSLIVSRLERELMETVRLPEVYERLAALAVQPNGGSARDLAQRIAAEIPRWAAIAKSANISLD